MSSRGGDFDFSRRSRSGREWHLGLHRVPPLGPTLRGRTMLSRSRGWCTLAVPFLVSAPLSMAAPVAGLFLREYLRALARFFTFCHRTAPISFWLEGRFVRRLRGWAWRWGGRVSSNQTQQKPHGHHQNCRRRVPPQRHCKDFLTGFNSSQATLDQTRS